MESEWARFFTLASIPDGIAARYAASFAKNRVTREMLGDLDKETLIDLGVTTVGDQIAIMKRVKAVAAMEKVGSGQIKKNTVTVPSSRSSRPPISAPSMDDRFTALDDRCASVQRRGKPPPDRHEIYHVKMPEGKTARTRQILQKVEALKRSGLHARGTSGVRKAGQAVLSVAEQRERDMEVSSTTGGRLGGLHVDRLGGIRGTGRIIKKRIIGGGSVPSLSSHSSGLFGAAMAVAGSGPVVMRKKVRVERIEGAKGRLPSVTLQLGNRVRVVGNGAGSLQKQVVVGGGSRRGLTGRVHGGGGRRGGVVVEYEDEGEEEMEEMEEIYEEEEEEVEYEDEEEIQYEDEMEGEDESTLVVGPSSSHGSSRVQTRYIPARQNHSHTNTRRAPVVERNSSIFDRIQFTR
ncbi:hypothetical protein PENTCL1PPCAC_2590 [Pristionchus entomophagus]|uniref:SAM domain-containing protein n=1 Tax=Pristionchus entomophagus TaxID=358040 RepID=A0AAV5SJT0_9BILA|nr:hypothetical protein PENTCL1PPCAC_2590 [Pristionchus entomophagus]